MHRGPGSAAPVCHAADIDDDAEFVLQHVRQHRLHGIKRALQIEVEGAVEQVVIDVEKFRAADGGARRVEQEMNAAEVTERQLDHVVNRRPLGHVDGERQPLRARRVDLLDGLRNAVLVDVGAHHIGAFARKDLGGGAADAAGGAGDDDGLSVEIVGGLRHGASSFLAAGK